MDKERLEQELKEIIVEKTGYPAEVLENHLELEADLGIDSLKQMNILAELFQHLGVKTDEMLEDEIHQILDSTTTIENMVDYCFQFYEELKN